MNFSRAESPRYRKVWDRIFFVKDGPALNTGSTGSPHFANAYEIYTIYNGRIIAESVGGKNWPNLFYVTEKYISVCAEGTERKFFFTISKNMLESSVPAKQTGQNRPYRPPVWGAGVECLVANRNVP